MPRLVANALPRREYLNSSGSLFRDFSYNGDILKGGGEGRIDYGYKEKWDLI